MPVYEYECRQCGQRFEVVQSIHDRPLTTHEACGGRLQKVFFPAGIIFKGSGFYSTDHRRAKSEGAKSEDERGKGEGKPAGKDGGKDGAKGKEPKEKSKDKD
ncbi:MAG: FmdB family transcriptional regulator [Actinomycetota bacterium]|nr:FmdB family transcriptional regulator [Actinomycetota bacterium]